MKEKNEAKITFLYRNLFLEKPEEETRWDEFFLLRVNKPTLEECVSQIPSDALQAHQNVFRTIVQQCIDALVNHSNIRVYNASETLCTLLHATARRISDANQVVDILFGPDVSVSLQPVCARFSSLVREEGNKLLVECILGALRTIGCFSKDLIRNEALRVFTTLDVLESLLLMFATQDYGQELRNEAMQLVTVLLYQQEDFTKNPAVVRFSAIEDNVVLMGLVRHCAASIANCNNEYQTLLLGDNSSILSSLSSKVFNLFSRGEEDDAALQGCLVPQSPPECLLFMYCAVRHNRNFVVSLTSPSSESQQNEDGRASGALASFLAYCSFEFTNFKGDLEKDRCKLCLLLLWHIIDEPYAQNVVHDANMAAIVPLYRPATLHKAAVFDMTRPAAALSETILELLTNFCNYHLMLQFPFEHYHIALSIIHRMLIYEKKCRIRIKNWNPLFNALISVLNYLSMHHAKLNRQRSLKLIHRVLVVFNFFITYGDTFLPNTAAYDFLYYEIARQDTVFNRLSEVVQAMQEAKSDTDSRDLGDLPLRVSNQLINILAIIKHIRPMLENISLTYPTEEQVIELIQSSFSDLTLKLFDGLELVESWEYLGITSFLPSLVERGRSTMDLSWGRQLSYSDVAHKLSSIQ